MSVLTLASHCLITLKIWYLNPCCYINHIPLLALVLMVLAIGYLFHFKTSYFLANIQLISFWDICKKTQIEIECGPLITSITRMNIALFEVTFIYWASRMKLSQAYSCSDCIYFAALVSTVI